MDKHRHDVRESSASRHDVSKRPSRPYSLDEKLLFQLTSLICFNTSLWSQLDSCMTRTLEAPHNLSIRPIQSQDRIYLIEKRGACLDYR
jgi:hypothetical protein